MKYQLQEHVSLTTVDDDAVLLDLDKGHYFGLNHVGTQFLQMIEKGFGHEQVITEIAQRYTIDYNQVKDDIDDLIGQLMEQNLLQSVNE